MHSVDVLLRTCSSNTVMTESRSSFHSRNIMMMVRMTAIITTTTIIRTMRVLLELQRSDVI